MKIIISIFISGMAFFHLPYSTFPLTYPPNIPRSHPQMTQQQKQPYQQPCNIYSRPALHETK